MLDLSKMYGAYNIIFNTDKYYSEYCHIQMVSQLKIIRE